MLPPPTCKAYPIALLLHYHWATPLTPPFYAIHLTILVMAISCKVKVYSKEGCEGKRASEREVERGLGLTLVEEEGEVIVVVVIAAAAVAAAAVVVVVIVVVVEVVVVHVV